jgi:hypothetical protein
MVYIDIGFVFCLFIDNLANTFIDNREHCSLPLSLCLSALPLPGTCTIPVLYPVLVLYCIPRKRSIHGIMPFDVNVFRYVERSPIDCTRVR